MYRNHSLQSHLIRTLYVLVAALFLAVTSSYADHHEHTTGPFAGKVVNGGMVTHSRQGDRHVLTLSSDFKVPDSPDPHWQVIDSRGNSYLLQRVKIKEDKINSQITLPAYIRDVAKVQMWCAWAEVVLGEASFSAPVK
jgi:hypothetical protein